MAEITYQGLSRVPDDYTAADGQAALSLNLVPENGALQPIFPPSLIFTLKPDYYKVAYIHKTTSFVHYIIIDKDNNTQGGVYYLDSETEIPDNKEVEVDVNSGLLVPLDGIEGREIITIEAIGNTLIIVTDIAINYYLWKAEEDGTQHYIYLGTHLPELTLSFGLQGEVEMEDEFEIDYDKAEDTSQGYWDENNYSQITEQVMAKVNKYVADHATNVGKFLFPFFVRYAYRLYDDSLTMHSAPILMITSTINTGLMVYIEGQVQETKANLRLLGIVHSLDYGVITAQAIETLKNWEDIIVSVDVFISAPIYTYSQGGQIESYVSWGYADGRSVCRFMNAYDDGDIPTRIAQYYQQHSVNAMYSYAKNSPVFYWGRGRVSSWVNLPEKSNEEIFDDIRDCCNFYLLKSIKIEDLVTEGREIIDITDDYLQSLVTRELMSDDYDSHDTLVPSFAYNYNNRLDIANIIKRLFKGYNPASTFCHSDGYYDYTADTPTPRADGPYQVYVYIRQDNKVIITETDEGNLAIENALFIYFYYPNTNAYKALIARDGRVLYELNLTPHDFLNGAYYFDGWVNSTKVPSIQETSEIPVIADQTVSVANKLYLSEINNPFFFPVENIVTVGTGTILGIATAAKPLSQGQFGSFPLYAFCDDGVWALSVNNEGIYSAVQPITRDVCINYKAITQLDSSVLFPTDRGIMQISGNAATCITDIFDSDDIYPIEKLPHYSQLLRLASNGEWDEPFSIIPITDFLATAVILYDYTNQRIYVCNDGLNYAYVLSTKSQQWGMATVDISSVVNSYPDAYAMTPDGDFVDFTHPDTSAPVPCMYVTRPLKLDGPNALKTVTAVLQRGFFDRRHVQSAIFGSRDLLHYHTIRTSQTHELRAFAGTPFKYFRLAILAQLEHGEAIFGATINSTPRLTNKAR